MVTSAEIDARVAGRNIPQTFLARVADNQDRVFLRWRQADDSWSEMTFGEFADRVARVASGLSAQGVGRGDRVMLMMRNIPEFHVVDAAALFLGATPLSIYNSSPPDQVEYLGNDSGAKVMIVEDRGFYELVAKVRGSLTSIERVGIVRDDNTGADFTYRDLAGSDPIDLEAAAGTARPDDLATMIYTSGTTGPPKGVMLDHHNICWTIECLREALPFEETVGKRIISYLPMAHIAERMTSHYLGLALGLEVTCCPDPTLVASYAGEVRPHVLFGVPRVWEKVHAGIMGALAADPDKKQKVDEAVEVAGPIREKMTFGTASPEEIETYEFLDAVAFSTIRQLVGLDHLEAAITGAAPIPPEVLSWFRTIGVPLSEIYGLSETCGPMTWEPVRVKPGYVGRACPGVEVKLAEDGEVMCRGGNVFRGYLNQPEKTAEVLDADGWFRSGDIGEMDDEGYLRIVDRKKELIITAGGKNVSPANLEAALKTIPLVGQACAVGDRRPFVSALVVLDPDVAPAWARQQGIEFETLQDLARDPRVLAEIDQHLARVMAGFSNAERVKKVKVLGEEWLPDSDVLTPTAKLKRRGIHARYAAEIESLYS
jgi:long-chain acyl-CoA synthetase